MTYHLNITPRFVKEVGGFLSYLEMNGKSENQTIEIYDTIHEKIGNMIVDTPTLNAYHPYFGEPYRALLYKFSPKGTYYTNGLLK